MKYGFTPQGQKRHIVRFTSNVPPHWDIAYCRVVLVGETDEEIFPEERMCKLCLRISAAAKKDK